MLKRIILAIFFFLWLVSSYFGWYIYTTRNSYSNLNIKEKKLLLFSENAFYYSFYDDLVNGKKINDLFKTDSVQYPDKINVVLEYKIAPEILLGSVFPLFRGLKIEVIDFYLYGTFLMVGLTAALVFLSSWTLSGSLLSSLMAFSLFFFSLPFSTRAPAFPALRENFAIPFWLLSIYLVQRTLKLKNESSNTGFFIFMGALMTQLLFWHFSNYNLILLAVGIAVYYFLTKKSSFRLMFITTVVFITIGYLTRFLNSEDGNHVIKYLLYRSSLIEGDFHTMIHWCDGVFQGLNLDIIESLSKNLLLPFAALGGFLSSKNNGKLFWILTALLHLVMAMVSNRFLVLAIPLLAVLAGEIYSWDEKGEFFRVWRLIVIIVFGVSVFSYSTTNLKLYLSERYVPNLYQTGLVNWIEKNTKETSVFSGPMNLTPTIRLLADRKIANNPFYENQASRARNLDVYQIYNKISEKKYHEILKKINTDYVVVDKNFCYMNTIGKCSLEGIFMAEEKDPSLKILCRSISSNSSNFKEAYSNSQYAVYKVL